MNEREQDRIFSEWSRDDGAQTAHVAAFDDEHYCEECDQPVHYDGPNDRYGTCGCRHDLLAHDLQDAMGGMA